MSIKICGFERWVKVDKDCLIGSKVDSRMRNYILNRDKKTCCYCGNRDGPFDIDHVMPQSRGGLTVESNLVCACISCNRSKKDRTPEEWRVAVGCI